MIVLIGSQKGGCGKSTIAVNICAQLAVNGRNVMLVDADRQGTSSNWCSDRSEDFGSSIVNCLQSYGNISSTLLDLNVHHRYVIVDSAARDSQELRTGMAVADVLVVPFRPSQPDLDTLPKLDEIIVRAKKLNPELSVYAVLTMTSANPLVKETKEAYDYLMDYPNIQLLNSTLKDRKVYRDAMSEGLGVVEMNNPKAKSEVHHLMEELFHDQT